MKVRKSDISSRAFVETYVIYDCSKTGRRVPEFATWDWSLADAIDQELQSAGMKHGVLAGYLLWDMVEVSLSDLRASAVFDRIFKDFPERKLGLIEQAGLLLGWKPDRDTVWYERIAMGQTLDETEPLIIRPALRSELTASWYIEDGSGRAIALIANHGLVGQPQTLAIGYLGRRPDKSSSFMQRPPFCELLG
jgi:hypothetical protein